MRKNCLLIQPCPNESLIPTGRSWWRPPLGLGYLVSAAAELSPEVRVQIWDELVQGPIPPSLLASASIIGISSNLFTLRRTLDLCHTALARSDALIVVGGLTTTVPAVRKFLFREVGERRLHLAVGDGEPIFLELLSGRPANSIEGLVTSPAQAAGAVPPRTFDPTGLIPALPHVDLYLACQREEGTETPVLAISTRRGCFWAQSHGRCNFCLRPGLKLVLRPPEDVASEIRARRATIPELWTFWDVSDDSLEPLEWWEEWLRLRTKHSDLRKVRWIIYGRADEVTHDAARLLKECNVVEVVVGFESGSKEVLAALHKGLDPARALQGASWLGKQEISVLGCFMIGCPGETNETLRETVALAQQVARQCRFSAISIADFVPLPGTRWWSSLLGSNREPSIEDFDPWVLSERFRRTMTEVTDDEIRSARIHLASLASVRHGFFRLAKT
ncbi:MAG: B12-binding domain-containing radical SAM protein [Kiritimatiellae bacterium]|nr:B12-binding domain-containing radical SAM protein [Kiritimatiellia bacterium]